MFTACLQPRVFENKKNKIKASKIKSVVSEMLYIQYSYAFSRHHQL